MDKTVIHITDNQGTQLLRMARRGDVVRAEPAPRHELVPLDKNVSCADDLRADSLLLALGISEKNPLKILAPRDSSRRWAHPGKTRLQTKLLSVQLPKNAFLRLVPGRGMRALSWPADVHIYIPSPALAVVNGAQALTRTVSQGQQSELWAFLRILEFIDECCGSYSRDPFMPRSAEVWYDNCHPSKRLADRESMEQFLRAATGLDGLLLARRAVRHAVDESGSPMESYIFHALSLPPRFGGLSMRAPLVNQQLVIDEAQKALLKHQSLRPDFQWPEYKTLAEYLGDKEHASLRARTEDKNRLQDYAATSYASIPLMFDDVRNASALNRTALMLAREFVERGAKREAGRLKKLMADPAFAGRQRILIGALLPPIKHYE